MGKHSVDIPAWIQEPAPNEPELVDSPVVRATARDAGCWVDGHHGWRGIGVAVEAAIARGWPITSEDRDSLDRYMSGDVLGGPINEIADDAEAWLTDNVAPDGYSFGWHDGEFFLLSDAQWCDAAGDVCMCVEPHRTSM